MTPVAQHTASDALDADYRFARPHVYLTPQELARVLITRSRLGDTRADRAAERIARDPVDHSLPR
jgi:hypothetical protein